MRHVASGLMGSPRLEATQKAWTTERRKGNPEANSETMPISGSRRTRRGHEFWPKRALLQTCSKLSDLSSAADDDDTPGGTGSFAGVR